MKKRSVILLILVLGLLMTGCATGGILYTHTLQPLTLDMHQTPITQTEKQGSIKIISLPWSAGIAAWGSAAIGDVAKKQGLHEVDFADLETLSILHIWNVYTIHVYGK